MNVMALVFLLVLLAIALVLGLAMEKLQKTYWFKSRFLMAYTVCLVMGVVGYFVFVAPSQAAENQYLTTEEEKEKSFEQGSGVLEDMTLADSWSVPVEGSLALESVNMGLNTAQFLIVNENESLSNQASVELYRPPSLVVQGKEYAVDFPSAEVTINEGQIQLEEKKVNIEYTTLGQSFFLEHYNSDRDNHKISAGNFSALVVEVPPDVEVENNMGIEIIQDD